MTDYAWAGAVALLLLVYLFYVLLKPHRF